MSRTAVLLVVLLAGCSAASVAIQPKDPNQALIEKWLKDNLDSPNWEVVKWWPVIDQRPLVAKLEADFAVWKQANPMPEFDNIPIEFQTLYVHERINAGNPVPPLPWYDFVTRFKFRSKNKVGALELMDMTFAITNGKVQVIEREIFGRRPLPRGMLRSVNDMLAD